MKKRKFIIILVAQSIVIVLLAIYGYVQGKEAARGRAEVAYARKRIIETTKQSQENALKFQLQIRKLEMQIEEMKGEK